MVSPGSVASRESRLLLPLRSLRFERDGSVVRLVRGHDVQTLSIKTDLTSEFDVEVLGGVAEGDRVLVADALGSR